jgi:hypothetical protein
MMIRKKVLVRNLLAFTLVLTQCCCCIGIPISLQAAGSRASLDSSITLQEVIETVYQLPAELAEELSSSVSR